MNIHNTIIAITVAALLAGCGVRKEDHRRVLNELAQTKRQLRAAATEVSSLRTGEVTRLVLELKRSNDMVAGLRAEVDRLKRQDAYIFTEAGKLLDAGDLSAALQAYQSFVRDFPSSPQVSDAQAQIQEIEQRLEAQQDETAARAQREREEREQKELAERIRGGMTVEEWWGVLRGKTTDQVKELLGTPGYTTDGDRRWTYYSRAVMPYSGKRELLCVHFRDGIVVATQGENPDKLFTD
jgi:hypothetical protein